ncbi:RNA-directed DNA polymerase, eukaryota [Tanacetum coccineum]
MGGLWVLIDFLSEFTLEKFESYIGVGSWFSTLQQASNSFLIDEKVAWVDIEGVPLNVWTKIHSLKSLPNGFIRFVLKKSLVGFDFIEDEDVEDESDEEIMDVGSEEEDDTQNDAKKSGCTLKYPPGFTHVEDAEVNSDYVDKSIMEENSSGILCVWDPRMFRKYNSTASDYFVVIQGEWIPSAKKCIIMSIYAPQEVFEKKMLWNYLNHVIDNWSGEVVIMGDFNEVRSKDECYGSLFNVHSTAAFNYFIS